MSGPKKTQELKDAYDAGERQFKFSSTIYAAKSVKNALIGAQHGKCCFCESKILHIAYGDVEHFRPKAGYVQNEGDPLTRPAYYWLAYDWSNLFLCCQLCNQRHKKNLFPLVDPSRRAHSHHDDLAAEAPMFLRISEEDPEALIGFRDEVAFPREDDPRVRITLEALGLNRIELAEMRRDYLEKIKLLDRILIQLRTRDARPGSPLNSEERTLLQEIEQHLLQATRPTAQYSSMVKAALLQVE